MRLTKFQKAAEKRLLVTARHCGTMKVRDVMEFMEVDKPKKFKRRKH